MSRSKEHKPKKQSFLITIKGEGVSAFLQAVKREGLEYMPTPNPGEFKVYYLYTRQVMHLGAAFHQLHFGEKQSEELSELYKKSIKVTNCSLCPFNQTSQDLDSFCNHPEKRDSWEVMADYSDVIIPKSCPEGKPFQIITTPIKL